MSGDDMRLRKKSSALWSKKCYGLLSAESDVVIRQLRLSAYEMGRSTGWEEGLLEGQLALIRWQLERRFGPLPPEVVERIDALSEEQVFSVAEALLTAGSLQ